MREDIAHFMETQIDSDELKKKLIPQYEVGCKRTTISNVYLASFNRQNVHLVTDGIQEISSDSVLLKQQQPAKTSPDTSPTNVSNQENVEKDTDKAESTHTVELATEKKIPLDAIIYATGFDLLSVFQGIVIERPIDGKPLGDIWGSFPAAYLGIMQPQFPNLFFLLGPGTGIGN